MSPIILLLDNVLNTPAQHINFVEFDTTSSPENLPQDHLEKFALLYTQLDGICNSPSSPASPITPPNHTQHLHHSTPTSESPTHSNTIQTPYLSYSSISSSSASLQSLPDLDQFLPFETSPTLRQNIPGDPDVPPAPHQHHDGQLNLSSVDADHSTIPVIVGHVPPPHIQQQDPHTRTPCLTTVKRSNRAVTASHYQISWSLITGPSSQNLRTW